MSNGESATSWIDDGKALLSSLMSHDHAKPLIDSFYDDNNNKTQIDKKLHFKQIENDLLNENYANIDALFGDVTILFENAMKMFGDADYTENIVGINEIFVKYKNSYKQNHKKQMNSDAQKKEKKSKPQPHKIRMQRSNTTNINTKRRRSARLAKLKNNDSDSDVNDIGIYIGMNVKNANEHKKEKEKKRPFTDINPINRKTDNNSNKIARISTDHTSPTMDISHNLRKRNRRSPRKKNNDLDDVDMKNNKHPYNLRSQSKPKHKLNKSPSKSPSKSKTPIAPTMTNKNKKNETENENECIINFADGICDSLYGKFENLSSMKYGCKAMCINGDFKPFNQDWISLDRFDQFRDEIPMLFTGVYDGHGILGHNASKYCARHLPKQFMFELYKINNNKKYVNSNSNSTASNPSQIQLQEDKNEEQPQPQPEDGEENAMILALQKALNNIDTNLKEIALNESKMFSTILQRQGCETRLIDYGTTINCLVSDGYDIFIINVGDSRCLLVEAEYDSNNKNKWTLSYKQVTNDHNAYYRQDEQERVKKSNGQFFQQNDQMELRLYPSDITFKEARRKGLAINMTRAVGHCELQNHGLIATPESYHINIIHNHEYIFIMASDGIWDILSNQQVFKCVQSIYQSFIHNQTNETLEHLIATELIENAQKEWRKKRVGDNISVVVTRILKVD